MPSALTARVTTTEPPAATPASGVRPEFVTLPARGGDPVCGLSRSFWYSVEADGLIRLVRIRRRGLARGRTLLPVDAAIALIRRLNEEQAAQAAG
jgi:hypothetical protein